jgi:hypothetical protein
MVLPFCLSSASGFSPWCHVWLYRCFFSFVSVCLVSGIFFLISFDGGVSYGEYD